MLRSMTAYGRNSSTIGTKEVSVEIKSVNGRFLDCTVRIPRTHNYLEDRVKKELARRGITRGKIEININITGSDETDISIDSVYAKAYIDALRALRDEFNLKDDISVMTVARNQDVFKVDHPEADEETEWQNLLSVLTPALDGFIAMRENEGENLAKDMLEKINGLRIHAKAVEALSESDIKGYHSRLEERLRAVLADNRVTADENRILTECAIFADKVAIDEELVRLESHFKAFEEYTKSKEPVGRKIDFLIQEMNRETNTIGSKCSDTEITKHVVEMKSELEKIREQIQNIE